MAGLFGTRFAPYGVLRLSSGESIRTELIEQASLRSTDMQAAVRQGGANPSNHRQVLPRHGCTGTSVTTRLVLETLYPLLGRGFYL
jgi:hypothetical protein